MDNNKKLQEKLIAELGLERMSQEKQEELLGQMTEAVIQRIVMESMQKLSDADRESYSKMIDEGADPEKIDDFLTSRIPDYPDVVERIIGEFKEEMKES
jgi:hypothetical protein